jgi:hypothetical protein
MLRSVAGFGCLSWMCIASVAVAPSASADETPSEADQQNRAARAASGETVPIMIERDLSGPRFGVTFRPDGQVFSNRENVGRVVSQFGWHFEKQIVPVGGGPQFILEAVPLIAGVEYGKFMPSMNLGMGIRFPSGYEFGVGPSVSVTHDEWGGEKVRSALFIAAGRSFDYGGVHLPVNVVVATNRDGQRASLIVGYAIHHASRAIQP